MQLSPSHWGKKRFSCSWASLHACSEYCFACTVSSCTPLSSLFPLLPSCFVPWLKAQAQPALLPTIYTAATITGSWPVKWIPMHYSTVNYHHRQACQSKLTKYILVMHSSQLLLKEFRSLIYECQFSTLNYMAISSNYWNSALFMQNTSWADLLLV